ncbi:uncharacterized protein LOC141667267 [Apium graveolens]|uniref:uncharacterized protein LOC141667267 n=1 Tax=Apium graveolens TaxID=4045 RepID=UPI003D7A58ED
MVALTESICWKIVAKAFYETGIGLVIYQKPVTSYFYQSQKTNKPLICDQNRWNNISCARDSHVPGIRSIKIREVSCMESRWVGLWLYLFTKVTLNSGMEQFLLRQCVRIQRKLTREIFTCIKREWLG